MKIVSVAGVRGRLRPVTQVLSVLLTSLAMVISWSLIALPAAMADTNPADPADPATPPTVAADALPTVQIDGVAWQQAIYGNTVYVVGKFGTARPAGAAAGTQTVPRNNILAYDLQTGELKTQFTASLNGQAKSIAISPDGSKVYVGGAFTEVNGTPRRFVAALNPTTGALISSWSPNVGSQVYALAATNDVVYMGGWFGNVGSASRSKLAAVTSSNATLLPWNPVLTAGGDVMALQLNDSGDRIAVGGNFKEVNGSTNPGWGMALLSTDGVGQLLPFNANSLIRNAGDKAAMLDFDSVGNTLYGSGYHFGGPDGNFEGAFAVDWTTGDTRWLEDCHGDTYGVYGTEKAVYTVSHAHYCGNIGAFPQTDPWTFHHALAFGTETTGTITRDPYGYFNFEGNPHPSLLNWYPSFGVGTYTGQYQAGWTVDGNDDYVVIGGEFPSVNNTRQQGLVRFAASNKAPNKRGPVANGAALNPTVDSLAAGMMRVSWPVTWDMDNENLTYKVYRDGDLSKPVYTVKHASNFWKLGTLSFRDVGLEPGSTHSYRIFVTDSMGNESRSESVSGTVATTGTLSDYVLQVWDDGASNYWRLGQSSGRTSMNWAGAATLNLGSGTSNNRGSALVDDADPATGFNGTSSGYGVSDIAIQGPDDLTVEAWVKTTSRRGGKILGFGNATGNSSSSYDRHVYMSTNGQIYFGVYPGQARTVNTQASYNDGQWHHVAASLGSQGMKLYVDGTLQAERSDTTYGQSYAGYWHVGGDNLSGWPGSVQSNYLDGDIDEFATYDTQLSAAQILGHYKASGAKPSGFSEPTDGYGQKVYSDGAQLYWRLNESGGATALDSSGHWQDGSYTGAIAKQAAGALVGLDNRAASFGTDGRVASILDQAAPGEYSTELWFNTTSTAGGRLLGFGNSNSGDSTRYDRILSMNAQGAVGFGVWDGEQVRLDSPAGYNDGRWHHAVATQNGAGMNLYLDGIKVASNHQAQADSYRGYWSLGADTAWDVGDALEATIDEVAVYPQALDAASVAGHYTLGAGQSPNAKPTADFTMSKDKLEVSLDASASKDSDGSISSYTWNFGDGTAPVQLTDPVTGHAYGEAGSYDITLTVTDDRGATSQTTQQVEVLANKAPSAKLEVSKDYLKIAADASASADSDGQIAAYAFDFGDGSAAVEGTASSAEHTYQAAGSYTVSLTVTDDSGASTSTTTVVEVAANQPPVAQFTTEAQGLTLNLDATSSTDSDGKIASYTWDFGDGSDPVTGGQPTASHEYAKAGTYTVTLAVSDEDGASSEISVEVKLEALPVNQPPTADFSATAQFLAAQFDASASQDPDGSISQYLWDFGDGSDPVSSDSATAGHDYTEAGSYTVSLTVTDDKGAIATATRVVQVLENQKPLASFTVSTDGLSIAVDASDSSDPEGETLGYRWDFGDGSDPVSSTQATAEHEYAKDGTYTVTLEVSDEHGAAASRSVEVSVQAPVQNQPPTAAFTTKVTDLQVQVDAAESNDPDGNIAAYHWDFGDGTAPVDGTNAAASHEYDKPGTYTITLVVTDDAGATAQMSSQVQVAQAPANQVPVAQFSSQAEGLVLSVDAGASSDPDGQLVGYRWDFGDGSEPVTSTQTTVSHDYAQAGSYEVELIVTDDQGANGTASAVVVVEQPAANQPPVAVFTSQIQGLEVSFDASGSRDADGSIGSYTWDFGDGSEPATGAEATATHRYAQPGSYTVSLQVADDDGAQSSSAAQVVIEGPGNSAEPVASFTTAVDGLDVTVDAAASTDPDGSIVSYQWDFGDGSDPVSSESATSGHGYAKAGTYSITLAVTDDQGLEGTNTQQVVVQDPGSGFLVQDFFDRDVSSGWGTAPVGGEWTMNSYSTSQSSVQQGRGAMTIAAGRTVTGELNSVSSTSTTTSVQLSIDKGQDRGGFYGYLKGRRISASQAYQLKFYRNENGAMQLYLQKVDGAETTLATATLNSIGFTANEKLNLKLQVTGTAPTTLAAKAWIEGTAEPETWQATATDGTAALQNAGSVGLGHYLSSAAANGPLTVSYDSVTVASDDAQPPVENQAPEAKFTTSTDALVLSADATGSKDPDGAIASYTWDFGDGTPPETGTQPTVQHSYASSGTYTVTLRVVDQAGASAQSTAEVKVTAPDAGGVLARDGFDRQVSRGWGDAQAGGAWSLDSYATSRAQVGDSMGQLSVQAGRWIRAQLPDVSSTDTLTSTQISLDKGQDVGGFYGTLIGRAVSGAGDYQLKYYRSENGGMQIFLQRVQGTETTLSMATLASIGFQPGDRLNLRLKVSGTSPTTLSAKVWKEGSAEPSEWPLSAQDSAPALQIQGAVGMRHYLSGAATNGPVTVQYHDIEVTSLTP